MKCKVDGCNRESVSKGFCDMHYRRDKKFGSPYKRGKHKVDIGNDEERFHKKYKKQKNGCWIWTAGTRPNGKGTLYGRHHTKQFGSIGAHRFSYIIKHGSIRGGSYICHKCDTPLCVNPDHLFESDHSGNMEDMTNKGRSFKGSGENKKGRAKLTNEQAIEILKSKLSQSKLAKKYEVSQTTIGRIKRGEAYPECYEIIRKTQHKQQ